MDSDFSEVDGSISLKLCAKKVKPIFDIQNGGLAAIFDVNTLGAIIWRTSPGFRSNLVQRDCIGGSATCMPFISCLVSKVATEWPYLLFYPHFQVYSHQTSLVSASRILFILKLFYKFLYLFSGAISQIINSLDRKCHKSHL